MLLHEIMTRSIGGLYAAPVDKAKVTRILDIGTGTGTCGLQLSLAHGSASLKAGTRGDIGRR